MNKKMKIGVVVVLIVAVGIVIAMKSGGRKPTETKKDTGRTDLPRLLELGSKVCIPCKMMAPILKELEQEHAGKLWVDFIDIREDAEAGRKYGVRVIPTQIFFDANGEELWRHEGFLPKADILAKWKELGYDFAAEASQTAQTAE
jgi:thioredoxin 1